MSLSLSLNQNQRIEMLSADISYAEELLKMAKNRDSSFFSNGKPLHAAIVMENIFRETASASKGEIRIYGKNLNGEISKYENYRFALISYLLAVDTRIMVIVDEIPVEEKKDENNAFDLLLSLSKVNELKNRIVIRVVKDKEKISKILSENFDLSDVHFIVSSENMYRFEFDSRLHFATCSFNDPEKSNKLTKLFDKMFLEEYSKEVG